VSGFPFFSSVEPPLARSGFPLAGVSGRSGLAGIVPAGLPVGLPDARVPPAGSAAVRGAADGVGEGRPGAGRSALTVAQKPATASVASPPEALTWAAVVGLEKAGFSATCGLLPAPAVQARHSPDQAVAASAGSMGSVTGSVSSAAGASDLGGGGDGGVRGGGLWLEGQRGGGGGDGDTTGTGGQRKRATTIRDSVRACMGYSGIRHRGADGSALRGERRKSGTFTSQFARRAGARGGGEEMRNRGQTRTAVEQLFAGGPGQSIWRRTSPFVQRDGGSSCYSTLQRLFCGR
jgi:hypothetical protein